MARKGKFDIALFLKKSFIGLIVGAVVGALCLALIMGVKEAFEHRALEPESWAVVGIIAGFTVGSVAGAFAGLITGIILGLRRKKSSLV